jgi:hypothetical protein
MMEEADSGSGATYGVLVIDDEPGLRRLCRRLLEKAGYKVYTAGSGLEGLRVLEDRAVEIQVVYSDVSMPKMGGDELTELVNERYGSRRRLRPAGFLELPGGLGGNAAGGGADIAGRGHDLVDDATVIEVIGGVVPGAGLEGLAPLAGDLGFFSGDTNFHEELSEGGVLGLSSGVATPL